MGKDRQVGILRISNTYLHKLLKLRNSEVIRGIRGDPFRDYTDILLEGPNLPVTAEGYEPLIIDFKTIFKEINEHE